MSTSDVIVGATGLQSLNRTDFATLKEGAIIASASSKRVEFDVDGLLETSIRRMAGVLDSQCLLLPNGRSIFLLADGKPVNFADGAVVGPVINLVQAELLVGLKALLEHQGQDGIFAVHPDDQEILAGKWLQHFVETKTTGTIRLNLDFGMS